MSLRRLVGSSRGPPAEDSRSGSTSQKPSCLMALLASTWVDFWHAAFVSRHRLEEENKRLREGAVRRDLDTCYSMLQQREIDLQGKVAMLAGQAIRYKQGKNLSAARKKMLERARAQSQLDKIQNSILMIDMHRSTIESANIDMSVLEALKASGDALRQMGVSKEGLSAVDDLVSSLEESMQSAADITNVLSSGSVTGMVNSMAAYGVVVDEDELMRELDGMMMSDEQDDKELSSAGVATDDVKLVVPALPDEEANSKEPTIVPAPASAASQNKTRKPKADKKPNTKVSPEKDTADEEAAAAAGSMLAF